MINTKILIVEDNLQHLEDLTEYLSDSLEKYQILVTSNSDEAFRILEEEQPDLIILDWDLQGSNLNGIQILTALKKMEAYQHIPVIMATQFTSSDMLDIALREGAIDYLRKPIDKIELLARVRAALVLKSYQRNEIIQKMERKLGVLFLSANPTDGSHLHLDQEYKSIKNNLERVAPIRDVFTLQQEFAVTTDVLMQTMLETKPNIVHFSGHGSESGIYVEDINGRSKLISAEALDSLFEYFEDTVECVLLNSCYSVHQAKAISKHVPYVIGMASAILDSASLAFSLGFYKALGAGENYFNSYKMGIIGIKLEGVSGEDLPTFITRDDMR